MEAHRCVGVHEGDDQGQVLVGDLVRLVKSPQGVLQTVQGKEEAQPVELLPFVLIQVPLRPSLYKFLQSLQMGQAGTLRVNQVVIRFWIVFGVGIQPADVHLPIYLFDVQPENTVVVAGTASLELQLGGVVLHGHWVAGVVNNSLHQGLHALLVVPGRRHHVPFQHIV